MASKTIWPKGAKCAVSFTFDFDGEYGIRAEYGQNAFPHRISMGEYAGKEGVRRILDLLAKYDVRGSFCVVGKIAEDYPEVVKEIFDRGHEVASHGYDHKRYFDLSPQAEKLDIEMTVKVLEKVAGKRPRGHRTPSWMTSPTTLSSLAEVGGFIWKSDSLDRDLPYRLRLGERDTGIMELPSSHLVDWAFLLDYNLPSSQLFETWKDEFETLYREGKMFLLTLHPHAIGRPYAIHALEKIIQHIKGFKGVWIARADEIAEWWRSREP